MNRPILSFAMLLIVTVISGCAALGTQPRTRAEIVMLTDNRVNFSLSWSVKAGDEFCIGETVTVYRWYAGGRYVRYREVGKVRITGFPDDRSFEGIVTYGEVRVGDLVRKSVPCRGNFDFRP